VNKEYNLYSFERAKEENILVAKEFPIIAVSPLRNIIR
jgi:hypothetical protein